MTENLCTGDAKEGGEGEGMLSTDSIKWSKHAPIISKRSIELKLYVCSRQKAQQKKKSAFLIPQIPSAIPSVSAGGFDCISNHEGYRGLMEGKVSLLHQAVGLFPLELRHGSSVLCCTCSIPQLELLNINTGRAREEVL